MDFFTVVEQRRSVRAFDSRPLEQEKLDQVLEAAWRAPSAGNLQAYEIYVVRQASVRQTLALAAWSQDFIAQAPLALVFCAHPARSQGRYGERGVSLYCLQDASIACAFATLAATALGLASVWVGAFDEGRVAQIIGAAPGHRPLAILPLGYPAEVPNFRPRRSLEEMVHQV